MGDKDQEIEGLSAVTIGSHENFINITLNVIFMTHCISHTTRSNNFNVDDSMMKKLEFNTFLYGVGHTAREEVRW